MFSNNREMVQLSLFSIILVFIPMFYFPARFGLDLATHSYTYSMLEIVFYGAVFFAFRPKSSLVQLLVGAGVTFLYRIFIGTVFGLMLTMFYGMEFSVSMTLGISRYMPSILLHILVAPFLMRSIFLNISAMIQPNNSGMIRESKPAASKKVEAKKSQSTKPYKKQSGKNNKIAISISNAPSKPEPIPSKNSGPSGSEQNGFERAVGYIGEHQAVQLAAVVDHEGLTMAKFSRNQTDPDTWAPYSVLFRQSNEKLIGRLDKPEDLTEMQMSFGNNKLTVQKTDRFNLVILADSDVDDLLNIRIAQGAEMVRKYTSERYGLNESSVTEEKYVSDTGRLK